jgi:hypothetical protein
MIPARPRTPRCHLCDASLGGPRVVIDGRWTCPDCAYKLDRGADPAELRVAGFVHKSDGSRRSRAKQPQDEALFPVARYNEGGRRA